MKKSRVHCACMQEVFCLMFLRDMDIDIGRVHKHVTGTADALEEPVLRDEMIVERDLVTKPLLQPRVLLPLSLIIKCELKRMLNGPLRKMRLRVAISISF